MTRGESYCGFDDEARWTQNGGQPVLMYHKFGHAPLAARLRALYVSPRLLRAQLSVLVTHRRAVGPSDTLGGANVFSVTIDDGFESALRLALPVLEFLRVTATLYLVAGRLGGWNEWDAGEPRERLMDAGQVREWLAAGQRIGSHTMSHPRLTELNEAAAREELRASRAALEDAFQIPVTDFCYPYGAHDDRVCAWTAEAGYTSAVTVQPGVVRPDSDALRLPRLLARHRWPGPGAVVSRLVRLFSRS